MTRVRAASSVAVRANVAIDICDAATGAVLRHGAHGSDAAAGPDEGTESGALWTTR